MEKSIKIISSINRFCEFEVFLNSIFYQYNLSRKLYCKIYIAVSEAVNNAIQHGNKNDKNKFIFIRFLEKKNVFIFYIQDEGLGFDYKNFKDPTLSNNIRNESGRGIFFMKKYANEVLFHNNGSCVQLIFHKISD
jgi:serine/threonine-protein kinase RsbW